MFNAAAAVPPSRRTPFHIGCVAVAAVCTAVFVAGIIAALLNRGPGGTS